MFGLLRSKVRGQETARWLQLLGGLSRDISLTTSNIEQSLPSFLEHVKERAKVDAVAVMTIDADAGALSFHGTAGLSERFVRYFNHTDRIRLGTGIIGKAVQDGSIATLSDVCGKKELGPSRLDTIYKEEGMRSVLVAPMRVGDKPTGAVVAFTREPHTYDANEQFFFEVLASQIAISLENSKSFRSIEKSSSDLRGQVSKLIHLQDSFQAINTYLNKSVEQAIEFLSSYVQQSFGGKGIAIFEVTSEETLKLLAAHGMSQMYTEVMKTRSIDVTSEGSLVARAFRSKEPMRSSRVFTDDRLEKQWVRILSDEGVSAVAVYPLQAEEKVFGALVVYYEHLHEFTDEENSVLGAFSQFLGILLENRQIFASLIAEKQKTQSIVYSLQDGLLVYDLTGKIIDINPRGGELVGIERAEVLDKTPSTMQGKSKGILNVKNISRMVIPDFETQAISLTYPRDMRVEITQVPLRDEHYQKTGSLCIIHDITKEYQSELLKINFLTTAAHQLRTPLTGINWGLDSLRSSKTGRLSKEQKEVIDRLDGLTKFMIALSNDLLSNAKIQEGSMSFTPTVQPILPIIHHVINDLAIQLTKRSIKVRITPEQDDTLPPAAVDASALSLALHNIIENAVNYSPDGGEVRIAVTAEKTSLQIKVADSGIGIPKEDQKLLFNRFFRGSNAVKVRTEGSGLGLFLAKSVIDQHKGSVLVQSEEGKGTTISIQLPLGDKSKPRAQKGVQ